MARFLFTVWPITSHLHSSMAVAQALHERGHDVACYTGSAARATVEGEGLTFFGFDRVASRLRDIVDGAVPGELDATDSVASSPLRGYDDAAFYDRLVARYSHSYVSATHSAGTRKAMYREWILGTVPDQLADLDTIVESWQPDAIVTDHLMWCPFLLLHELRRLPVAVLSFYAGCLLPGPDAPPAGLGLPRPHNWHTRLRSKLASVVMDVFMADLRREASSMRQRYGLPPLREGVMAMSGRLPLHLVCATPEYDYQRRDLPPSVHYVGPCMWDRPSRAVAPTWLAELPTDQAVIYVTEGTAQVTDTAVQRAPLLHAALQGLANLRMQVILTTGRNRDPQQLGLLPSPPNVRVERFVPHSDLFPHLSVVVTNGGSQTVRTALAAGLPLLIVPMEWDQFENAQRVVEAGVGLRLSMKDCTPSRLRQAVQRLLSDPTFGNNARRLSTAFARYGNTDRAVQLLEGLALVS